MTYKSGDIFTLEQVLKLDLPDSPFLMVRIRDGNGSVGHHAIQTSHFCLEDNLTPELAATWWKYSYTTREECPIFYAVDKVCHLLDVQPYISEYVERVSANFMLTPKGFPRKLHESEIPLNLKWKEVL